MTALSPNIVLIMADQLAPQFTGAYGHPLVKTPAMQNLVSRGARFDAAYCNSPLCAPSRFSFMSGHRVTKIAAYDNASEFPASIPTFAHYLRMMGYKTCLSGKMHFVGPDQLHGFDERVTTDIYPADFAWTPDWELPDERIDKWYHNMDSVREAGVAAATFQIDYDEEVAFYAKRKLIDYPADWGSPGADRMKGLALPYKAVPAGSEGALITELKSSIAKKSPLVMVFWQPHWALSEYEVEWVDMPKAEDACFEDPAWGVNPAEVNDCDFSAARVFKVVWTGLEEKWPAAFEVLKSVSISTEDQQVMMAAIDQEGGKVEDIVGQWMTDNESTWQAWVDAAN